VTELVEALADHAVALREAAASAPPAAPKRPAKKTVANAPSATATTKRVPAKA
jgi:hypothetical protein